ncbi:MAG: uroporphyrinogen-III synthase [Alcaligenaceae bacterium]|nr:uroporphyrinogen-III synthase [Alcaligenaceae bacterium]
MQFDLVVNTRPAHKSSELLNLLTDFEQLSLPALTLLPLNFELPKNWQSNDFVFFVSQFAVDSFFARLKTLGLDWPNSLFAAAVGQVSADALIAQGVAVNKVLVAPQGEADSESFLDWFQSNYQAPKQVMIVRAEHGRNWLNEQLQKRQVKTTFLAVYQRGAATWSVSDKQPLLDLLATKPQARVCWLLTSRESVDAVLSQWQQEPLLAELCWQHDFLVFHPRIAEHLKHKQLSYAPNYRGKLSVHLCQPDNPSIVETLQRLCSKG